MTYVYHVPANLPSRARAAARRLPDRRQATVALARSLGVPEWLVEGAYEAPDAEGVEVVPSDLPGRAAALLAAGHDATGAAMTLAHAARVREWIAVAAVRAAQDTRET